MHLDVDSMKEEITRLRLEKNYYHSLLTEANAKLATMSDSLYRLEGHYKEYVSGFEDYKLEYELLLAKYEELKKSTT